jgi:hypothetical protein
VSSPEIALDCANCNQHGLMHPSVVTTEQQLSPLVQSNANLGRRTAPVTSVCLVQCSCSLCHLYLSHDKDPRRNEGLSTLRINRQRG